MGQGTGVNVVDSSGWIEYFTDGPGASFFAPAIEDISALVVPTIVLNEVLRKTLRDIGDDGARSVLAALRQGRLVPLDEEIAESAARIGLDLRLPLADAIVLATARRERATLWTQDADFEGMPGVRYRRKAAR
jgi:predicted nucleic acid-binding protein